ncbi:unnamed protein product [Pleuronectes platessa]|uniref:Uncharacterized protein n=1 Tax=Pleuronectes platessa TaxID=8262 RepID=A0A9N7UJ64_PLEPL|nr:unnamed protein product [Pleuronectes platessa]
MGVGWSQSQLTYPEGRGTPWTGPQLLLHPKHPSHPTPSCINASNPLCGRVTSATVRNRVKLSKHQENGVELPASGITKHSAPPEGRLPATEQNPTLFPSVCSCLPPAGEQTGKTI